MGCLVEFAVSYILPSEKLQRWVFSVSQWNFRACIVCRGAAAADAALRLPRKEAGNQKEAIPPQEGWNTAPPLRFMDVPRLHRQATTVRVDAARQFLQLLHPSVIGGWEYARRPPWPPCRWVNFHKVRPDTSQPHAGGCSS